MPALVFPDALEVTLGLGLGCDLVLTTRQSVHLGTTSLLLPHPRSLPGFDYRPNWLHCLAIKPYLAPGKSCV